MKKPQRPLGRPIKDEQEMPTEQLILQTATRLFLERGYQAVSMDDVAEQSDVTKATVYYYFKKKSELFLEAMLKLMDLIHNKSAAFLTTDEPLKVQLFKFAKAHLKAVVEIDISAFMREAKISLTDEQILAMEKSEQALYRLVENTLTNAMERGKIPHSDAQLATLTFINMLTIKNAMSEEYKSTFANTEELAKAITDFYWYGISGKNK